MDRYFRWVNGFGSVTFAVRARLPVLLAALPVLTACVSTMRSDVVTFHDGPLPMGETIRVDALDTAKAGTLEFRQYARQVNEELRNAGYEPVEAGEASELVALLDYSVMAGPTDLRVARGPHVYYHFSYGRFRNPYYIGVLNRWEPEVRTTPTYIRSLSLVITRNQAGQERLFEARVESIGSERQLPDVMPYLITALFSNFPGESGVTKVVTIEMD